MLNFGPYGKSRPTQHKKSILIKFSGPSIYAVDGSMFIRGVSFAALHGS